MSSDFLPFATGGGANVEAQGPYSTDPLRGSGNLPGIAISALNNKALRQGTVVAAAVAQCMADATSTNADDDGNLPGLIQQMEAAFFRLPAFVDIYGPGTVGTWFTQVYFFVVGANVVNGDTYSNNGQTFTIQGTAGPVNLIVTRATGAPSFSGTLTRTSGTGDTTIQFYAFRAPINLEVSIIGGGGGGGGANGGGNGNPGAPSNFAGATASGGSGGIGGGGPTTPPGTGGAGGTGGSLGGYNGFQIGGGNGSGGVLGETGGIIPALYKAGGSGGSSFLGGAGGGNYSGPTGAYNGSGSGGAGQGTGGDSTAPGGGGGAGEYVQVYIPVPGLGYSAGISVGNGGAGATGGGGGLIIVKGFFQ